MSVPILHSQRLTLRGPKDSDAAPLGAFLESARAAWIGGPWPASDAAEWLTWSSTQWAIRGRGTWIVALGENDRPIGRVGLLDHEEFDEPELSWFLFDGFEGQGFAQEAALAARTYCHVVLGLPPLFSLIEPSNLRSKALVEHLGATPEREITHDGLSMIVYRHPSPAARA